MRNRTFWQHVDQRSAEGCWTWTGCRDRAGYGQWTECLPRRRRVTWKAHRYAWTETIGPITDGLHVLHHCDNASCVRPDHLFLGTALDNARDKVAKGRMRRGDFRGEANGHARLTEADVLFIRSQVAAGVPQARMVERFGVAPMTVSQVVTRKTWRHVA
jgi:hypothetical protein